ncbi:MAG: A24 family peptidase, partial [Planctomycetia bacterium]|nr:A24 family peptidase [Planctomycetia bacterium]
TGLPVPLPVPDGMSGFVDSVPYTWLVVTSPERWDPAAYRGIGPLVTAIALFLAWCFAMTPRSWYPRHGRRRAMELCLARMRRSRGTRLWLVIAAIGSILILCVWYQGRAETAREWNGGGWGALYSSLIGLGVGGGLVWYVRTVGQWVLRREAMGFGDVTLMAMLGVWFGWQGAIVIFMLAAIFGLLFGILVVIVQKRPMPYGPFLAMAATVLLFRWPGFWRTLEPTLSLFSRTEIAVAGGGLFLLMGPLLWIVRNIRTKCFGNE